MVTRAENERLTRVGPGTPMGELLRRYWHPILFSNEVDKPDGPPLRVRILGEDLLAFRDTAGDLGLVDAYCPHRRAQLFFGRNEKCGIRCVYHGWKFDVNGNCVELPSEPASSGIMSRVKIKSYPVIEKAGLVWTYMGPPEHKPAPPDYEWTRTPDTHRFISKNIQASNYLQGLEGGLDTSHSTFLHDMDISGGSMIRSRDGAPKIEILPRDYGYSYVSRRNLGADGEYVRVYQYIMPFTQFRGDNVGMTGQSNKVPKIDGHLWVPIDDHTTMTWNFMYGFDQNTPIPEDYSAWFEELVGRAPDDYVPGTYMLKRNLANDYLIDREVQRTKTSSGIEGINTQDLALQESMGTIVDRSREILVTSDNAIIAMRKMMLKATHAIEQGEPAPGADPLSHRGVRAYDCIVPAGANWQDSVADHVTAKW